MPRLQIVVDYILEQVRKRNVDEIEVNVYRRGTPSEYNRTRQFQQAWKADKSTISGNTASGKFHYDPDSMEYDAAEAQHGSTDPAWGDAREYLAELIYNGASGPKYGDGYWTQRRDAWDALIEDIDGEDIVKWTRQGFAKAGLTVTKKGG